MTRNGASEIHDSSSLNSGPPIAIEWDSPEGAGIVPSAGQDGSPRVPLEDVERGGLEDSYAS
jgi:hypothetical protein